MVCWQARRLQARLLAVIATKAWVPDAEAGGGAEVAACRPWAPPCAQLFWPAAEPSAQLAAESPAWRGSCCQLNTVVRDDD